MTHRPHPTNDALRNGISLLFVIGVLLLYFFFPTQGTMESLTAMLVFLVFMPLLYLRVVLNKSSLRLERTTITWISVVIPFFAGIVLIALFSYGITHVHPLTTYQTLVQNVGYKILFLDFSVLIIPLVLYAFFAYGFVMHILTRQHPIVQKVLPFMLFVLLSFPLLQAIPSSLPWWVVLVFYTPLLLFSPTTLRNRIFLVSIIPITMKIVFDSIIIFIS